jgi:hypothetical protein
MEFNDSKKIEAGFQALSRVGLTERERHNLRLQIMAHMRAHPVSNSYVQQLISVFGNFSRTYFAPPDTYIRPAFALGTLVLVISVGTTYNAQYALPGQALYAVKTHVNESIQGALAFSPAAQTEWSAELTFRRLQEAEELAATGNLTPVASANIEQGLNIALNQFDSSVQLLEAKDSAGAANVQSNLEASLNAHETVLSALARSGGSEVVRFANAVETHSGKINRQRSKNEQALIATDSPQVKNAALVSQQSAEDAVQAVQVLGTATLDPHIASSSANIASEAKEDIKNGREEARHGRWGRAYGAFQDASRKAKETKSSIDTRSWLKEKFGVEVFGNAASTTPTTSQDENSGHKEDSSNSKHGSSHDSED